MFTVVETNKVIGDRPSFAQVASTRSFLEQVEVIELSLSDIECLASFESIDGVYHRLLNSLSSHVEATEHFPVLVEH